MAPKAATPIYEPHPHRPMSVVFFASGGPGNVETAFEAERASQLALRVDLVVTDRPGIPAIDVAHRYQRPCLVFDFQARCGRVPGKRAASTRRVAYMRARREVHTEILHELQLIETRRGFRFDLAVLAYRRIIDGPLFSYFEARMINQHPADLADRDSSGVRRYIGIGGHDGALKSGRGGCCTSTIVVRKGVDDGEILVRGPWHPFSGDPEDPAQLRRHESEQKVVSDRPALRTALLAIAQGRLGLSLRERHDDGCAVVHMDDTPLPYGGIDLSAGDVATATVLT